MIVGQTIFLHKEGDQGDVPWCGSSRVLLRYECQWRDVRMQCGAMQALAIRKCRDSLLR